MTGATLAARRDEKEELPRHGFRLFQFFILAAAAAILAIVLLTVSGLRGVLRDVVITEAEADALRITTALRDMHTDSFVRTGSDGRARLVLEEHQIPDFDQHIRGFLEPFDIVKVKVFDLDTRIIYSTDLKIIGRMNHDNAKLESALAGIAVSKLEKKDAVWDMEDEERFDVDIVETYTPVVDQDGHVLGSFEVYKDVTLELRAARTTLVRSMCILVIVLFVVFAALSALMYRASRILRANTRALEESHRKVESLNSGLERRVRARTEQLANRAKTEFLANVGHEFRTPLHGIMGFNETIQRLVQSGNHDGLMECTQTVQRMAVHLARLVDDVMDITAIEAQRIEMSMESVSPRDICQRVLACCASEAHAKGLTIQMEVSDVLPTILADIDRLTQALVAVTGNAIKFTGEGSVTITARAVTGSADAGALAINAPVGSDCRQIEFLIEDTGPGIDEKDLERIFERFERLETSGAKRGSGLGLAISRKLVEAHGGRIWAESTPGAGSVFHLTIPVAAHQAVPCPVRASA